MPDLTRIPHLDEKESLLAVVEAPRGSSVKLKFDPELRVFKFHSALTLGVTYPYDWGFIPSTIAEDGDPLDAMVMFRMQTWPGIVIPCRAIGIVEMMQSDDEATNERNDRIIAVPVADPRQHVDEISKRTKKELEEFFIIAACMTHKDVKILDWKGPKAARRAIEAAHETFKNRNAGQSK